MVSISLIERHSAPAIAPARHQPQSVACCLTSILARPDHAVITRLEVMILVQSVSVSGGAEPASGNRHGEAAFG
jgi:hypothetical protein